MKKVNEITMIICFVLAGISAVMCYNEGFRMWFWQVICMAWIGNSYFLTKVINRK